MCNIAGYAGNKNAAPILLEMIRKQQGFDGGVCTGISTIYNGRIYTRKVFGDVDTLINTTDALYLPGTIGIAHTRPGGKIQNAAFAHPFLTPNEDMTYVTNGTGSAEKYRETAQRVCTFLEDEGYNFRDRAFVEDPFFPKLKDGSHVSCVEVRINYVDYHIRQGKSIPAAMSAVLSEMYTDNVTVLMNLREPEKIFALRVTRPMAVLLADGETYMATTRMAFPESVDAEVMQLPLHRVCTISRGGVEFTEHTLVDCEPVCEVTPHAYAEVYKRISDLLRGKKDAPLYFDDLEIAVSRNMRDIWDEQHFYVQDARLAYDVIYQLQKEGRLCTTVRPMKGDGHVKDRIYMWIEE